MPRLYMLGAGGQEDVRMEDPRRAQTRRDLLIATGTCAFAAVVVPDRLQAQEIKPVAPAAAPGSPPAWQTAMQAVTGDAKVIDGGIVMDVPEIAENGNVVPCNLSVDSPMTGNDMVRSLRIFSTGNPQPLVATFRFSVDSGRAAVSARIRLAGSQDVIALAELADGTFRKTTKNIKVTIGGCGG